MGEPLQIRAEAWLTRSRRSSEFFVASILRHRCSYNRLLSRNLRLAVRCLGVAAECPAGLVKEAVGRLVRAAARQSSGQLPRQVIGGALRQGAANAQVRRVLEDISHSRRQKIRDVAREVLQGDAQPAPARVTVQKAPSQLPMRPRLDEQEYPDSDRSPRTHCRRSVLGGSDSTEEASSWPTPAGRHPARRSDPARRGRSPAGARPLRHRWPSNGRAGPGRSGGSRPSTASGRGRRRPDTTPRRRGRRWPGPAPPLSRRPAGPHRLRSRPPASRSG